jgi:ABC-type uncharacterized transport system permease subunit
MLGFAVLNPTYAVRGMGLNVGWAERSDAQQHAATMLGFALSNQISAVRGLGQNVGWAERSNA